MRFSSLLKPRSFEEVAKRNRQNANNIAWPHQGLRERMRRVSRGEHLEGYKRMLEAFKPTQSTVPS